MVEDNKKRRRSNAFPDANKELPNHKRSKEDGLMEVSTESSINDLDRRKRVREILRVINRRLLDKDIYRICHSPPCSLLYPNYPFDRHLDMAMISRRVDQLAYFNIAQYRAAVNQVVKCQTEFFPMNTVRHEFAFRFEQFARKQTTYRALMNLCKELEIKDELSKKEIRDILVGTDMSTEKKIDEHSVKVDPTHEKTNHISTLETMDTSQTLIADENFPRRQGDNFTTLAIASGAFNEARINGKPVTLGDITGRVIGAPTLPRKTRTIEDKAYTISYLQYGPYGSFGPEFDSRSGLFLFHNDYYSTFNQEDSDLLFQVCGGVDKSRQELEKIAKLNPEDDISFLVHRSTGNDKAAAEVLKRNERVVPDPTDLLTLERDGIDVSFLSAFDPTVEIASEAEVADVLSQLAVLLPQLAQLQDQRLIAPNRPPELIAQLDQSELRTAAQVQKGLATALKQLAPGVAYDSNALRRAIGVKSEN